MNYDLVIKLGARIKMICNNKKAAKAAFIIKPKCRLRNLLSRIRIFSALNFPYLVSLNYDALSNPIDRVNQLPH